MKKRRRYRRYPVSVRQSAIERMALGMNVSELAEELGVNRTTLYIWQRAGRKPAAGSEREGPAAVEAMDHRDYRMGELETRLAALEAELGRAELEKRFFEAALRRIKESQPRSESSGATAFSPRSANRRMRKAD